MFQLRAYDTEREHHDQEQLPEQGFNDQTSGVFSKAWLSRDRLFVSVRDSCMLLAFNKLYNQHGQVTTEKSGELNVRQESPITELLLPTVAPSTVIVVYQDGALQTWNFNQEQEIWSCHGNLVLALAEGDSLTSIRLHEPRSAIWWCNRSNEDGQETFSLSTCVLPRGLQCSDNTDTTEVSVIIRRLPSCGLHLVADSFLLWPEEPCPPGMYMMLNPSTHMVHFYIFSRGLVHTQRCFLTAIDFHQVAIKTASIWVKADPVTDWLLVADSTNGRVLCIDGQGHVHSITEQVTSTTVCKLCAWSKSSKCHGLVFRSFLFISSASAVRVFALSNGCLLQQMAPLSDVILGTMTTGGDPQEAGFHTGSSVYNLERASCEVRLDDPDSLLTLNEAPSMERVTQTALESVYNKEGHWSTKDLLERCNRLNPAQQVALLHKLRCHDNPSLPLIEALSSVLRRKNLVHRTGGGKSYESLFKGEEPFIQEFCELEEERQNIFSWNSLQGRTFSSSFRNNLTHLQETLDIHLELRNVLTSRRPRHLDLGERYGRYSVLSARFPEMVLHCTLQLLGFHGGSVVKATVLPSCDAGDNNLLPLMARLLYIEDPGKLMAFMEKIFQANHHSSQSISLGEKYRQLLAVLPDPERSKNVALATMATAQIMLRTKTRGCECASLVVLMKRHLWREAVQLVEQQPSRGRFNYDDLYQLLLSTAVKEGVFPAYSSAILKLTPALFSGLELVRELQKMPADDNVVTPAIFCADDAQDDVPLSRIATYLLGRLVT